MEAEKKPDALEQRVQDALKAAYRDGPEFMQLRQAVTDMIEDRRKLMVTPAEAMDQMLDDLAEGMTKEAEKAGKRLKAFGADLRNAFEKLTKDE